MNKRDYNKMYREKNREVLRTYYKSYYEKNKEIKQKQKREYHHLIKNNPEYKEKRKRYYETNKYLITKKNNAYKKEHRERYTELSKLSRERKYEQSAGRPRPDNCEICGSGGKIVYDHDHATGKFRGWICHNCNTALGHARDRTEILQKMIDYLSQSRKEVKVTKEQLQELGVAL